jgi:predicted dehydrogenase
MISAIKEGREPLVNGFEGIKPLEIITAIYQSADSGEPVSISSIRQLKTVL